MSNNEDTVTISVDARLASMADEIVSRRAENAKLREARDEAQDAYDSLAHIYAGAVAENAKLRAHLQAIVDEHARYATYPLSKAERQDIAEQLTHKVEAARLLLEGGAQ
jgi:hypothetical protein